MECRDLCAGDCVPIVIADRPILAAEKKELRLKKAKPHMCSFESVGCGRTGGDNEFLRWLGEEPGGLILPNMYDAARRRSGAACLNFCQPLLLKSSQPKKELADFLVAILKKAGIA